MSEPLKRASRLRLQEPPDAKPGGVFARVALSSSGRVGVSSNCIACVMGSKESPEADRKEKERQSAAAEKQGRQRVESDRASETQPLVAPPPQEPRPLPKSYLEAQFQYSPQALLRPAPLPRSKARQTLASDYLRAAPDASPRRYVRSCSVPRRRSPNAVTPAPHATADRRSHHLRQHRPPPPPPPSYGAIGTGFANGVLLLSDSSSCDSVSSLSSSESPPMLPPCSVLDNRKRAVGTLQREMNALFAQKMEELRLKSPMFFAGKMNMRRSGAGPCSRSGCCQKRSCTIDP